MLGTPPRAPRPAPDTVLTANRLVFLAAVPLFLVLAVVAYITIQFAANERQADGWVRHSYQVMEAERRLQDDVQTAETAARGFLISHDPPFLTVYRNYVGRLPADLKNFRDLTADNPDQQKRAVRIQALIEQRLRGLDIAIRLASQPAAGPATPAVTQFMSRARTEMGQMRAEVTAGLAEEQKLLGQRDADRIEQERLEIAFALGAGILAMGILLTAAALLVRNNINLAGSERARTNEAAILQTTLDTAQGGIAYFTSEGLLCAFNAGFFRLLDLPARLARLRETQIAQFETAGLPAGLLAPPRSHGGIETRHMSWKGRELDIYKAPVVTGGFLIGVTDVTARIEAEHMARQSQKMEAIGHLTGGVAHDFNNLLQIVTANLDMAIASGEAKGNPRLGQRLQNAMGAVSRGSRLTGQLLAFARRQALDPRSVDLGRIIRDMSDLLRRTLGENIEVETLIPQGLWNTLADPGQVENAILNLAINARDAMPDGGKLTLEVANAWLDEAYAAENPDVTPSQYVMLSIADTGTGMSPEVLSRAFEPFFSTKPEGKGTGLGLAQAYGFVKQSGGHIKIYSQAGDGTTVKIYLPRTRRAEDRADAAAKAPAEGGSERILVVEDDEGVRAAVVDMLTDLGYAVSRAESAEAALTLLEEGTPVDLLFTDVVMPGAISTRDFAAKARQLLPGLLVLYTSGYTKDAIVHNGKLDQDAFLLSKPYRKDELARKLRGVFAARRGASPPPQDIKPPAPRGKVLVVEDVALIRMATVDMIEHIGFSALEAGDAAQALSLLKEDGDIEILLTDLGLPGMNGRQLVEEARRLRPGIRVIIASGYASETEAGGRPQDAEISHLVKPFDLTQLRKVLNA